MLQPAKDYNLDAMEPEELDAIAAAFHINPPQGIQELFPDNPTGPMRAVAAGQLADYALTKARAIRARRRGKILTAQVHEARCDEIYRRLPGFAKGW